ncbi:MAG: uL15m family ribosomal protein [Candidatus Micrarchaeaceae archaeon]
MVVRNKKHSRRYLGARRWGKGNIKNARGAGDRGGVGRGNKKNKFTYITAKEPWLIRKKGFTRWNAKKLGEINLDGISKMLEDESYDGKELELINYKVLGNGTLRKAARIKADGFSKNAIEKIKAAGGEAVFRKPS